MTPDDFMGFFEREYGVHFVDVNTKEDLTEKRRKNAGKKSERKGDFMSFYEEETKSC